MRKLLLSVFLFSTLCVSGQDNENTLWYKQAAKDWNIDLQQSYMIGDSDKDVAAGQNSGVKQSLLIASNSPDSLLHAVHKILSKE